MKHRNCDLLIGYWNSLRTDRRAPAQSDIDPRSIGRVLPTVFILDVSNRPSPTYRLAGTALCKRFDCELRGRSFLAHWDEESSQVICYLMRQALKVPRPICLLSFEPCPDGGIAELETVLAPISIDGGEPTRFFGMVQVLSEHVAPTRMNSSIQTLFASQLVCDADLSSALHTPLSQLSFANYHSPETVSARQRMRA
jgi:hypothetical protein